MRKSLSKLKRLVKRLFYRLLTLKRSVSVNAKYTVIKSNLGDTFTGYYDINPANNNLILFERINVGSKTGDIGIYDIDNNKEKILFSTKAWNWQQGSRQRWFKSGNYILYNDLEDSKYVAKVYDMSTSEIKIISEALYDVSRDYKLGLTLNFGRLGYLRPGYGYTCLPLDNSFNMLNDGIHIIDLTTGERVKSISYTRIAHKVNMKKDLNNTYINHLSFSPSGNKFLFFYIEIKDTVHQATLIVYDIIKDILIPVETTLSVSHYYWVDEENILITAYDKERVCRYYLYNINGGRTDIMHDMLKTDGHPTYIMDNWFVTDTYPDRSGFQYILLFNPYKNICKKIGSVYSYVLHYGEQRCDLHPKYDNVNNLISIDADIHGKREIILMKAEELI